MTGTPCTAPRPFAIRSFPVRCSHACIRPAPADSLRQFRHDAFDRDMSPLLVVDHVQWRGPELEPNPHAGLSVATLLFEHALGEIESVDSMGARHRIRAGDLHWTLAGRGMVRRTEAAGEPLHIDALQILVNLPSDLKQQPPASFHLPAAHVPVLHAPGSRLRLLAGSLGGQRLAAAAAAAAAHAGWPDRCRRHGAAAAAGRLERLDLCRLRRALTGSGRRDGPPARALAGSHRGHRRRRAWPT